MPVLVNGHAVPVERENPREYCIGVFSGLPDLRKQTIGLRQKRVHSQKDIPEEKCECSPTGFGKLFGKVSCVARKVLWARDPEGPGTGCLQDWQPVPKREQPRKNELQGSSAFFPEECFPSGDGRSFPALERHDLSLFSRGVPGPESDRLRKEVSHEGLPVFPASGIGVDPGRFDGFGQDLMLLGTNR